MNNLGTILATLYPNAARGDYTVQDDSDGKGPYIAHWDVTKLGPQPDEATLLAAEPAATAAHLAKLRREAEAETSIKQDAVIASIKSMTQAEYDAWWAANVTNAAQAIGVLKRVVRIVCRRLL